MALITGDPDIFDYVTFISVAIGLVCDILIIDTIIHKQALRHGVRLIMLMWAICDLFYLFNTSGFLHLLLKALGFHVSNESTSYSFQPHLMDEPVSGLLLQAVCLKVMWLLAFTPCDDEELPARGDLLRWLLLVGVIGVNLVMVFVKFDVPNNYVENLRRVYAGLLVILVFVNEFQYFRLMCDDDIGLDVLELTQLRINIVRVYAYNWCLVYFMKYVAACGFHDMMTNHTAAKYLYAAAICFTLTAFLTSLYVLIHLLCNDLVFRQSFICTCPTWRRGNSINGDPNELRAIIMGRYNQMYYTSETM